MQEITWGNVITIAFVILSIGANYATLTERTKTIFKWIDEHKVESNGRDKHLDRLNDAIIELKESNKYQEKRLEILEVSRFNTERRNEPRNK